MGRSMRWATVLLAGILIVQIALLGAKIDPIYAHAGSEVTVPVVSSDACVYGNFDSREWSDAARIDLETGSEFYLKSTENKLLFGLIAHADETVDERDGMWLYVDTKHDGGTSLNNNDWRFWIGRDGVAEVWNFRNGEWETKGDPFWFSWKVRSYSDRWVLEACIRLVNDVEDGTVSGIMIRHDDYDAASNNPGSGVFPEDAVYNNPDTWGDAKFKSLTGMK